ncbi:MAG TPA: SwmB domain-containing protein, partial [Candidatus Nanoarchaeia archaeon]|nr:SwmB domain-containing protein [Candidatus Nanoarchaeia archaeon]
MNSPIKKVAVVSLIVLIIGLFAFIAITIAHMTRTDAEPLGTETSENLNAQVFQPVEYEQYNYYNLNLDADSEALLRYSDPEVLTNMPGTNFDTTPPTITDAVVSSNILTLSFSETLNPNSQPATSNFIVTFGSTNITVSSVSVTDTRVMLTLATNALHTTVVTVTHTPTDTQIRDLAGNASPGFTRVATNSTPPIDIPTDTTPPTVTNARISNKTLTLTYNETIDQNSVPPTSAFTLRKNNGSSVNITRVRISGSSVILDLDTNPGTGSITLKYAVPSSNPIQDAVGNDAPAFSNQTVTVTSVVTTNTTSNPNTTNSTVRSNTNT